MICFILLYYASQCLIVFTFPIQCSPLKPHVLQTEPTKLWIPFNMQKMCFYYLSNKTSKGFQFFFKGFLDVDQQLVLLHFASLIQMSFELKIRLFYLQHFSIKSKQGHSELISSIDDQNFFLWLCWVSLNFFKNTTGYFIIGTIVPL